MLGAWWVCALIENPSFSAVDHVRFTRVLSMPGGWNAAHDPLCVFCIPNAN